MRWNSSSCPRPCPPDPGVSGGAYPANAWMEIAQTKIANRTAKAYVVLRMYPRPCRRPSGCSEVVAVDIDNRGSNETTNYTKICWDLNDAFESSGAEQPGLSAQKYDLVNSRLVADGIEEERWQDYVEDLSNRLRPGGWLQMVEVDLRIQSNSGDETPFLSEWWSRYSEALTCLKKDPTVGSDLWRLVSNADMVDVTWTSVKLPIGDWHKGTLDKFVLFTSFVCGR